MKYMSLKDNIFQFTLIQVTMFCPLTLTSNILKKLWERVSVWPLPKKYNRGRRSQQSRRWKSTSRCRQTLEPCFGGCKGRDCQKRKLSQDTFSEGEQIWTSSGWIKTLSRGVRLSNLDGYHLW